MNAPFHRNPGGRIATIAASTLLPEAVRAQGLRLAARLSAPVRVVVAGPARSGKSALVRLLAGQNAGAAPAGPSTGKAGVVSEIRSASLAHVLLVEFDFKALSAEGAPVTIEAAAPDIVLWCTNGFGPDEAAFWAGVPDHLKDNSFLVLTKADQLIRLGHLLDRLESLREVVDAEFHSLLPIATSQALDARSGTEPDPVMYAYSGAEALIAALQDLVEQGRQADLDAAELFVHRYAEAAGIDAAADEPEPETAPAPPPHDIAASPAPEPPAAAPDPAPSTPPVATPDANETVAEQALGIVDARIAELPDRLDKGNQDGISTLLSVCGETAEALTELVIEGRGICEDLSEDVLEASEMMVLLTLEDDENAAADALTLLLQLRRGFEARLAA